jgi:hypothetical protein
MFLYSASLYITYNGFGNSFTYNKIVPKKIKVEESENNYHIIYSFEFNNRIYENDERVIKELYLSKIKNQNEILISFNNIFPELNFVQQFNLALRNQKIGMVVSIIGILFFFILDFFADKNYWLDKYHKFFNKI